MSYLKMSFKNAILVAFVCALHVTGITGDRCGYSNLASYRLTEVASMRLYELSFANNKTCEGTEVLAYSFTGSSWNKRTITWNITQYSVQGGAKGIDDTIEEAFDTWAEHIPFKFERVKGTRADVRIRFGSQLPGRILGVTQFSSRVMDYYGGDIAFNDQVSWSFPGHAGRTSLLHVAVHEIGHALGLGHSEYREAIMFPSHDPRQINPNSVLHSDDIAAIQKLYGTRTDGPPKRKKRSSRSSSHGESGNPRPSYNPPGTPYNPRVRYNPPTPVNPPISRAPRDPSITSMPPVSINDPLDVLVGPIMNPQGELIVYIRVAGRCGPYRLDSASGKLTSYF